MSAVPTTILAAVAIVALFTTGCSRSGSAAIPDPTKKSVITLRSPIPEPNGITIRISGKIDGGAVVYASSWDKVTLSGAVDW